MLREADMVCYELDSEAGVTNPHLNDLFAEKKCHFWTLGSLTIKIDDFELYIELECTILSGNRSKLSGITINGLDTIENSKQSSKTAFCQNETNLFKLCPDWSESWHLS